MEYMVKVETFHKVEADSPFDAVKSIKGALVTQPVHKLFSVAEIGAGQMAFDICDNCWVSPASTAVDGADGVQVHICTICADELARDGYLSNVDLLEEEDSNV